MSSQRSPRQPVSRNGRPAAALVAAVVLVVLPAWALSRLAGSIDGRLLAGGSLALSLAAALAHYLDKRRAEAGAWRIPEATLHTLELLGGWPGAFLAQRLLRHKVSKGSYQAVFWLIVVLYQLAAVDSLRGWPWCHRLIG